jgi:hypothetical protein
VSPPTPGQVHVATDALRGDAAVWAEQAGAMGAAAAEAGDLAMTRLEAGVFQVLVDAYAEVQAHVTARSAEAHTVMTEVAGTLRAVADTYDREEARHEHALRNLY